ncbi:MAG: hypothetical protein CSA70_06735 [Rhodobacterales bacterium]|nr:MAG: hypothetical protein CSA70_06735 [Rhodobacterales bacterium]
MKVLQQIDRTKQDAHPNADMWAGQLFSAQAVAKGGVLRRSVASMKREVGRKRLMQEIRSRNFRLLEVGAIHHHLLPPPHPKTRVTPSPGGS